MAIEAVAAESAAAQAAQAEREAAHEASRIRDAAEQKSLAALAEVRSRADGASSAANKEAEVLLASEAEVEAIEAEAEAAEAETLLALEIQLW